MVASKVKRKKVIWFDETKMEFIAYQTCCYVRQTLNTARDHKHTISSMKHGDGGIMLQ